MLLLALRSTMKVLMIRDEASYAFVVIAGTAISISRTSPLHQFYLINQAGMNSLLNSKRDLQVRRLRTVQRKRLLAEYAISKSKIASSDINQFLQIFNSRPADSSRLEQFCTGLSSQLQYARLESLVGLRKIVSEVQDLPIHRVTQQGVCLRLVQLLKAGTPLQQYQALWVITNICAGQRYFLSNLLTKDLFDQLLLRVDTKINSASSIALDCFYNLCGLCPQKLKKLVAKQNLVQKLMKYHAVSQDDDTKQSVILLISRIILIKKNGSLKAFLFKQVIPSFLKFIVSQDKQFVFWEVIEALTHLSAISTVEDRIIKTISQNKQFMKTLIQLINNDNKPKYKVRAIKLFGYQLNSEEEVGIKALNHIGGLQAISMICSNNDSNVRKYGFWLLSLTACLGQFSSKMIQQGWLLKLKQSLLTEQIQVRKKIVQTLLNICQHAKQHQLIAAQRQVNLMSLMVSQLKEHQQKLIYKTLKIVQFFMVTQRRDKIFFKKIDSCGLDQALQQLQFYPNDDVYNLALSLLDQFYQDIDQQ